jgi:hypothetical protein
LEGNDTNKIVSKCELCAFGPFKLPLRGYNAWIVITDEIIVFGFDKIAYNMPSVVKDSMECAEIVLVLLKS